MPLIKIKECCLDCGQPLVAEDEIPEGVVQKSIWDGVYQTFFMVRRERWVCMNPKCKSYYPKTNHKFLKGLTGLKELSHQKDMLIKQNKNIYQCFLLFAKLRQI